MTTMTLRMQLLTKVQRRSRFMAMMGSYGAGQQDAFEYAGHDPVVDMVSTLRGAGYGSLTQGVSPANEDEEALPWGLDRFEDRKVARSIRRA